jgi:hypothetical protein
MDLGAIKRKGGVTYSGMRISIPTLLPRARTIPTAQHALSTVLINEQASSGTLPT